MRRLHLIRHAPVVVDFAVPAREWRLAPEAKVPVAALASDLADARLKRIVASPEPKAIGTGKILGEVLDLPVEVRDGLEEHHRLADQQTPDRSVFVGNVRRFFERPGEVVFGSESAHQALARFQAAVTGVMAESTDDELIVTHGTVMSLLASVGGVDPMTVWSTLRLPDRILLEWPSLRRVDG